MIKRQTAVQDELHMTEQLKRRHYATIEMCSQYKTTNTALYNDSPTRKKPHIDTLWLAIHPHH